MSTTINRNLPTLSNEGGLSAYLEQIKKFPMLAAEEEYMLAKNWKTTGNVKAAEKLVEQRKEFDDDTNSIESDSEVEEVEDD